MGFTDKLRSLFGSPKLDVAKRFELIREAVHGTMSRFYVARDRETGEIVGLKICDRKKRDTFEGRFTGLDKPNEGEIGASFDHPLIVKTHEYGETTDGEFYIIMDFLDGPGLNTFILQKSPVLDGKRLKLIRDMAEALAVVHEADYIHRDVCPRNFICSKDATEVRLIDFGLTVPATKYFLQPGNRTGTPNYMAPEVVRRRATDHRLDIFAFGVTVFQMCAYDLPWPSQDVTGKAAMKHDTKPPNHLCEVRPQTNEVLGNAVMSCISVSPDRRPQTVRDFIKLISRVEHEDK